MNQKRVRIEAHSFDSLPAHVTVVTSGVGSNSRIALQRALGKMFGDRQLKRKQIHTFKLSVSVAQEAPCTSA